MARYSWERLVWTLDLPDALKLTALAVARYADPDGSRAYPGNRRLAFDLGASMRTVIRRLDVLRDDLHIIERTFKAAGRPKTGKAALSDEYRLVCPSDLADRVTVRVYDGIGDTQMSPITGCGLPSPNGSAPAGIGDTSERIGDNRAVIGDTQMSPHQPSTPASYQQPRARASSNGQGPPEERALAYIAQTAEVSRADAKTILAALGAEADARGKPIGKPDRYVGGFKAGELTARLQGDYSPWTPNT